LLTCRDICYNVDMQAVHLRKKIEDDNDAAELQPSTYFDMKV